MNVLNSLFFGPGAASYGLATLVFAAFAVHLSVGWKGGAKATLLLGTVIASALWAALSNAHVLGILARLKAGISLQQATTEMTGIAARLEQVHTENRGEGIVVNQFMN